MPVKIKGRAKNINIDQNIKKPKKDEILQIDLQAELSMRDNPSRFKEAIIDTIKRNM